MHRTRGHHRNRGVVGTIAIAITVAAETNASFVINIVDCAIANRLAIANVAPP